MNKYYGSGSGSLWEGNTVALLLTHGYDADYATEPFVTGVKRLCEHSKLMYAGMYSVRDTDDLESFTTPQAENGARVFAQRLIALEKRKQAAVNHSCAPITKAGFSIRVAVDENDSAAASEIYAKSWRAGYKGILSDETIAGVTDDGWNAQFESNFITNRFMLLIMSADGKDIGACAVGVKQGEGECRTAEIISFYYIKEYWGKKYNGISYSEHLMRYVIAVIRRQGYESVALWALKDNGRAIAFYNKCGFLLTGNERRLIIKGEQIMAVELEKELVKRS
jgi:ribosomal protein S18 acetylase RimI-like enzyme